MKKSKSAIAVAIALVTGYAGMIEPASAIVPDGHYNMIINDTPYNTALGRFDIGTDGNWNSSFTFGCYPGTKGCVSQGMYDSGLSNPNGGSGSGIGGDGVSGILDITVNGGTFTVNTFNKDVIRFTAGGDFFQYTNPVNNVAQMGGTITGTSMVYDPTNRLASITSPPLIDKKWNVDDCTLVGGICDPVPNGNTAWDVFTTQTATNTKGTITGTPLANLGDINGDDSDDFSATLVSGGVIGSDWGGFFGAQYFEVWNVTLLSVDVPPPLPTISIVITGGSPQECTGDDGRIIPMNVQVTVPEDDAIDTISWTLDGTPVASGEAVEILVPLGTQTVEATLSTVLGNNTTDSSAIDIEDTVAPVINAEFINTITGTVITAISRKDKADVSYTVTDACDKDPIISATAGVPAQNGDTVSAKTSKKDPITEVTIESNANNVELSVTAEDSFGNMSNSKAALTIIQ